MDYTNPCAYPHAQYHNGAAMYPAQAPGMGWPHGHGHHFQPMAFPAYPAPAYFGQHQQESFFNDKFVKGLVIGAAAAYVLTNEPIQRAAIKGVVKVWTLMQGGVEELKERFRDAEAEVRAQAPEHE